MDTGRIKRVIEGALARDHERFAIEIKSRLPSDTDPEVLERFVEQMRFYIETAPEMLDVALNWTRQTGVERYYQPIFGQIEAYFINPDDEIEDQTHGLLGVLDDAYLALRTVQAIQEAGMPLLTEAHLSDLNALARQILGAEVGDRLDERVRDANSHLIESLIRRSDEVLSAVAAATAAPPMLSLDAALVGHWRNHEGNRLLVFSEDGRFRDGASGGRWEADGMVVTLIWENHTYSDQFYEVEGDTLLLKKPGRRPTFWNRADA